MSEVLEIYQCSVCGTVIEVVKGGAGTLVCCEKEMVLQKENVEGDSSVSHRPVIVIEDKNVTIRVSEIPHPMSNEHYIPFIEAISKDKKYLKRKYLNPGDIPDLSFICSSIDMTARAFCNLHGLWKNK